MTIKQAFIGIVTAIALVIAVLISQIVRINTMTGDLQEAQTRIETLETKAAATPKPESFTTLCCRMAHISIFRSRP